MNWNNMKADWNVQTVFVFSKRRKAVSNYVTIDIITIADRKIYTWLPVGIYNLGNIDALAITAIVFYAWLSVDV